MPNYTKNYNLEKPLPNENYNVEVFNNNADIIDQKLKEVEDSVENIEVPVTSVNGKTGDVEINAEDIGAETPEGAQAKADTAEENAKAYVDQKISSGIDADKLDGKQASDFQNAIAIGSSADPNTTTESYILTNHANSPNSSLYWHIQTYFYSSKTGNRAQIAIPYNGSEDTLFVRHNYGGVWTSWKEIGGGTMFADLTPKMAYSHSSSSAYTTVVNVSGSGYLTSVSQYVSPIALGYLRITIDGTIIFDNEFSYNDSGGNGATMSSIMRFNSSLKVEHKDNYEDSSRDEDVNTVVSYLLD